MGFLNDDLNNQRPSTAATPITDFPSDNNGSGASVTDTTTPPGNGNTISDSVAQQQKETEEAFNNGLVGQPAEQTATQPTAQPAAQPTTQVATQPTTQVATQEAAPSSPSPAPAQTETAAATNEKKIDWSQPYSEIEKNEALRKMTPHDIMRDFQKNGDENWAVFMPWLQKYDPDKTVEQSEKEAAKARRQAKWEQWGNLFQHIGNFFGTAIGAPSQKIESATELTERQRKIREATDALRQKGYDQMMVNIYKDRADKQAQMQAEANAKAKAAEAEYRGAQRAQTEALTPEKVKTEQARQAASAAAAGLSTAKTKTEDELRGKRGALITAQTNNANAGAADHAAGVAVKGAQVRHINSQTEGQNIKNAAGKEADNFNYNYVNDPTFKKYVNQWAKNNGMAIGDNVGENGGRGGTWANEKNRQQASKWAKEQMKRDRTPPSRRAGATGGSKVPPSRRKK